MPDRISLFGTGIAYPVARYLLHKHEDIVGVPSTLAVLRNGDLYGAEDLSDGQRHDGSVVCRDRRRVALNLSIKLVCARERASVVPDE